MYICPIRCATINKSPMFVPNGSYSFAKEPCSSSKTSLYFSFCKPPWPLKAIPTFFILQVILTLKSTVRCVPIKQKSPVFEEKGRMFLTKDVYISAQEPNISAERDLRFSLPFWWLKAYHSVCRPNQPAFLYFCKRAPHFHERALYFGHKSPTLSPKEPYISDNRSLRGTRARDLCKRALHLCKRARDLCKRALHLCKRTLHSCQKNSVSLPKSPAFSSKDLSISAKEPHISTTKP